ncbi:MAG: tyrosine-type recombinase/integrase [Dissulfurispiraceae bacterium]
MTQTSSILQSNISNNEPSNQTKVSPYVDHIVRRIRKIELPGAEYFESYMRHKWRMNHRPNTLKGSFGAVSAFLTFYHNLGKIQLKDIVSDDLEAFVESMQDRGLKVTTVRTNFKHLCAFLRFLTEHDIVDASILKRKIKLRVPDLLPRAIAPGDVRKLLGVIEETRDRALVLVLLRTGMRIGELLRLKM